MHTADEIIGKLYRELTEATERAAKLESELFDTRRRHTLERDALVAGHQAAMKAAGADLDASRLVHVRLKEALADSQAVNARAVVAAQSEYDCGRLAGEALAKLGYRWDANAQRWRRGPRQR
ncbi:MAG TPA: hypothetical protein VIK52_14245 [Opitutaceae bacterium]